MRTVSAHIVHPVQVNQHLLHLERSRGSNLLRFVLLMERGETWAIDDIRTNSDGLPIGLTDDRGTAEQRIGGVTKLEQVLNSQALADCLESDPESYPLVSARLIHVLAHLRTGRFLLCLHHLSNLSAPFVNHLLEQVGQQADVGDVMAHVLRERLIAIRRANMVRAIFSPKAAAQVSMTLERIK